MLEAAASRRVFLETTMGAIVFAGCASYPPNAFAEEDVSDLSMPTPEEDKAAQVRKDSTSCVIFLRLLSCLNLNLK